MKVSSEKVENQKFKPVRVSITLETAQELESLLQVGNYSHAVAEEISKLVSSENKYFNRETCVKILNKVFDELYVHIF